jgi:anti-sigma factor RsiW
MNVCDEQLLLPAYHDGELDAGPAARVEAHLRGCATCAAELEQLRAAAAPLRALRSERLSGEQLAALHAAIDDAAADDARTLRTAATLAVIAASVLIVGTAWLRTLPTAAPAPVARGGGVAAGSWSSRERAWEHVAVTLRPDPLTIPQPIDPTQYFAHAYEPSIADWMLDGLQPRTEP